MKILIGLAFAGTVGAAVIGNMMNVMAEVQAALNAAGF